MNDIGISYLIMNFIKDLMCSLICVFFLQKFLEKTFYYLIELLSENCRRGAI